GDGALGSSPILMVVGVLMGLVGGFLHVLRVLAPDLLPFAKRLPAAERDGTADRAQSADAGEEPGSESEPPR
ncbi:MAG: AtpZ/AtpI family protein, partial [Planctomycetota bacterium]|nr:AtpZ/AtpI family protein [Planctomycetota bacterium]